MDIDEQIALWDRAVIRVLDLRHVEMVRGEVLAQYSVPASVFLLSIHGSAQVQLDRTEHVFTGFQLLHSGKGSILNIVPASEKFEYYTLYYHASIPEESSEKQHKCTKRKNPFQTQYHFTPAAPILFYHTMQMMDKKWNEQDAVERFKVKSLFYQFVQDVLKELRGKGSKVKQVNIPAQIVHYIKDYYAEPISLDSLADLFNYSAYHLSSMFKAFVGVSPIDYLIRFRLERATELLISTDISISEIAASVGYKDTYYFSRIFKQRKGVTPTQFRASELQRQKVADSPFHIPIYSIVEQIVHCYIDNDNHYRYNSEGDLQMIQLTKPQMMTSLLLCLSLALGACSNGTNAVPKGQSDGNGKIHNEVLEASAETRIVSTLKGDVEIPAEPKRVAADQYMGQLLKLGIVPVGVRGSMLDEGWMGKANISKDLIGGIENLGNEFPLNLEKMAMLEPDLIIGSVEEYIDQYEKIGPTVFYPYWVDSITVRPLDKFRGISKIFGKEKEAEAWIAGYEQKVAEAKAKISGIVKEGETVSVIMFSWKESTVIVYAAEGGNYGSSTIYEMLGLPPTESAKNMKEGYEAISFEVLPEYLGDHIFVYNGEASTAEIMQSPVWKSMTAVKNGKVYVYGDSYYDEFAGEDPYSLELQLDTIVNLLLDSNK